MPFATSMSTRFGKPPEQLARKMGGHGGMDYIMNYRLMDCLKRGLVPDINVYDAAAWSAPTPLSEASVAQNGAPQKFPGFHPRQVGCSYGHGGVCSSDRGQLPDFGDENKKHLHPSLK